MTKIIRVKYREELKRTRVLFIDECSFFAIEYLQNLDKKLRLLRERYTQYSDVSIVFAGDFYQLNLFTSMSVYKEYHMLWHSLRRKVVKLKIDHRFDNDKEFSEMLDENKK